MSDLPHGIESTFRFILIAARRAEQLIAGARPRVPTRHVKPTTVALDELAIGKVPWHPVTAEEYEALLHQEAAARENQDLMPALFPTVPPVIPVAVEADAEADEEEEQEALEDELEGPEFDENLEVVNEAGADELLAEEVPAPEE